MSVGIKETKEIISGVKLLGVDVASALADGKIDFSDVQYAVDLAKNAQVLVDAVNGANQVGSEIKDLDQAELLELGTAAFDMVKSIIAASKKA